MNSRAHVSLFKSFNKTEKMRSILNTDQHRDSKIFFIAAD